MTCAICWEDMDMTEFNDERESTETCFKLECRHSFHTKCIVQFLSRTRHACPSCNKIRSPENELATLGLAKNLLSDIRKDPEISHSIRECSNAFSCYNESLKILKKETINFIAEKKEELKIIENKNYVLECISHSKKIIKQKAVELGNKYIGALNYKAKSYDRPLLDSLIYPRDLQGPYWKLWRLKHPRISVSILTSKHNKE